MSGPPKLESRLAGDPRCEAICTAVVETILERGFAAAEVEEVRERAGLSAAGFERRFAGLEDCVLAVYEHYIADFVASVQGAYEAEPGWRDSLRAAGYAASRWIVEHPGETRFGMVEVLGARGEMFRVRREQIFVWCGELIDAGRAEAADPDAVPPAAAVMAIGSIAEMLTNRLRSGRPAHPHSVVPELMYIAVRPYLGEEAAREELEIPPPSARHGARPR